jgi:phosphonate transport system substrate-binding protein
LRAVLDDEADVCALGITTWNTLQASELTADDLEVAWTSPQYSHCNFTARPDLPVDLAEVWVDRLLEMDWEDPEDRRILELEGLTRWVRPELAGYQSLFDAMADEAVTSLP